MSPAPARQQLLIEELARQMQEISEKACFSRWGYQVEDLLPPVLVSVAASGQSADFQGAFITPLYAQWLVSMSEELGHWVNLDNQGNPFPYHPPTLAETAEKWKGKKDLGAW